MRRFQVDAEVPKATFPVTLLPVLRSNSALARNDDMRYRRARYSLFAYRCGHSVNQHAEDDRQIRKDAVTIKLDFSRSCDGQENSALGHASPEKTIGGVVPSFH